LTERRALRLQTDSIEKINHKQQNHSPRDGYLRTNSIKYSNEPTSPGMRARPLLPSDSLVTLACKSAFLYNLQITNRLKARKSSRQPHTTAFKAASAMLCGGWNVRLI
jgi:hypothetical protein